MSAMLRLTLASLLVIAAAGTRARADDDHEPPVAVALGAGAGLAITPLLAGGVLFASTDDDGLRRAGTMVAMAGLTLAPIVSHVATREYKRAAIFGAVPLAALITNAIVFAYDPKVTTYGSAYTRTIFGVALTAGVLGAVVGLADSLAARDRWRRRHPLLGAAL